MKPSCGSALRQTPTAAPKSRRRDAVGGDDDAAADAPLPEEEATDEWPNLDSQGELQHCSQPRSTDRPTVRFRIVSPLHDRSHHLARRRLEASSTSRHRTSQTEMQPQMRPSRGKTPQLYNIRRCAGPSCGRPSHQVCKGKKTSTASSWYESLQHLCLLHRSTPESRQHGRRVVHAC